MTLEELEIIITANIDGVTDQLEEAKSNIEDAFKSENVEQFSSNLDNSTEQIAKFATEAIAGANGTKALSIATKEFGIALNTALPILLAISVAIMVITEVANKVQDTIDSIKKTLADIGKTISNIVTPAVKSLNNEIKSLTAKGVNNLVQANTQLNQAMSQIYSTSIQLGNALGTVVAPVIEAITPIIVSAMNVLIEFANIVAQVTAGLFGNATTYRKATKVTADYGKTVGGAAKEQKKLLAGFDELNVLEEKSSSGGGSTPLANMFETAPIKANIDDLYNYLGKMGDKLGNFIATQIEKANPEEIGKAIGTLISGAFRFVANTAKAIPFKEAGEKLSRTIIAMIQSIKVEDVADAITSLVGGIADFAIGFFGTWISSGGWLKLMQKIHQLFQKIPWKELLPKVIRAIMLAWVAINGTKLALKLLIWAEIINMLNEFKNKTKENVKKKITEILENLGKNITEKWDTIKKSISLLWGYTKKWWSENVAPIFTFEWWADKGTKALNGLKEGMYTILLEIGKNFVTFVNNIIDTLNKLHIDLPDWLGGGRFGIDIPKIQTGANLNVINAAQTAVKNANKTLPVTSGVNQSMEASVPTVEAIDKVTDAVNNLSRQVANTKLTTTVKASGLTAMLASANQARGAVAYGV